MPGVDTRVYLEGLNGYKNEKCEPKIEDNLAVFELSLINFYECGIIRVVNKLTVSGGDQSILYCSKQQRVLIDFLPQCSLIILLLLTGQEDVLP